MDVKADKNFCLARDSVLNLKILSQKSGTWVVRLLRCINFSDFHPIILETPQNVDRV
jgi:hypothetical protein